VSQFFYSLATLACPIGMGAMMWFMMRGSGKNTKAEGAASIEREAELLKLRAEVDELRASQAGSVHSIVNDRR